MGNHALCESQEHVAVYGGLVLDQDHNLPVYPKGHVIVAPHIHDVVNRLVDQLRLLRPEGRAVQGVVERDEILLRPFPPPRAIIWA